MKEPLFSRLRKKPTNNNTNNTNTYNTTTPSRKLKLVCSFNGAFNRRPPSNKLRYVGGETRIVSVDRNIGFLKLCLKISDLCPNLGCFSLRYQLPADTDTPLVLIDSDEDVRCMIEEYDKLVLYGKHARLWLFVCNDHDNVKTNNNTTGVVKRNSDLYVNSVDTDIFCPKNGVGYDPICGVESQNCETNLSGGQFDANVAKNLVNAVAGVKYGDDSLRKMVLKQQLLAKQSARVNGSRVVSGLGVNETEVEHSCCDHPLIDLGPEPKVSMSQDDPNRVNMIDCKLGNAQLIGSENYGGLVQNTGPRLHPLNPRDGNLCVDTNGSMQCLVGWSGQVLGNGAGISSGNLSHSVALTQVLKQSCHSSMVSMFNGADATQDIRHIQQVSRTSLNRENIMPWAANCDLVKTPLAPLSCGNQWVGSTYPVKSPYPGNRVWGGYQDGIRNHKFGVNDSRNQRIYPYYIRNHRNNLVEVGNYRAARLNGRLLVGKCYPGLRPNSNISKQGQSVRLYHPNSWKPWPGFPEHSLVQRVSMIDSGFKRGNSSIDVQNSNENIREHHGPAVSQYRSSNPKECHVSYQGACAGLANQILLSCNTIESPPSRIRVIEAQKDLLTGSHSEMLEAPYQTLSENFHGVPINCEPILCDPKKDKFLVEPQKVFNNSGFSNNTGYSNGTGLGYNTKLLDTEAGNKSLKNHNLQNRIASSVDLLYNLSLSSSKEVEPLTHSSLASSDVSDAMLKPQSKPIDLTYKGQFSTGPQVDEPHGVASDSCSQKAAKVGKDHVHEEEIQWDPPSGLSINEKDDIEESRKDSKVIGVISGDLAAIYTHLATRELQTIKNSDLEYIKELGSGTYGTVFYGKWKGSDVAIKRLKPSCFTESSLDEDRLVSDFWREAHMLGQLHHPNIVAFYGVVTDGPVIDLATVTEYMVNGSLKQVLQRKDRTIDRRKRLVIAMDAAFGMEYLHEKSIVHFDLKSHNFLVNMRDPQRPICKIGDLGLSKIKQRTLVSGGVRGTIPWMAPELLNSKNNMVTEKVDVYSFGIVMWELLTGDEPYANLRSEEIIAGIIKGTLRPEIPTWCDPAWRSLMERCWSSDPDSRPAFSEIAKELRAMSAAMNIK